MRMALVCEQMGWSAEEYFNAPDWFIETLFLKWECEGEKAKWDLKKLSKKR